MTCGFLDSVYLVQELLIIMRHTLVAFLELTKIDDVGSTKRHTFLLLTFKVVNDGLGDF